MKITKNLACRFAWTPRGLLAAGWPQGRNALYKSLKNNEIPHRRIGGNRILIPTTALMAWLNDTPFEKDTAA
jgi:excisionase family DNA binding protein